MGMVAREPVVVAMVILSGTAGPISINCRQAKAEREREVRVRERERERAAEACRMDGWNDRGKGKMSERAEKCKKETSEKDVGERKENEYPGPSERDARREKELFLHI